VRSSSWARIALVVALLLLAGPAMLLAHQSLRRSVPEKDSRLDAAPRELRLTFNEPVDFGLTRIVLLDPAGNTAALGPLERHADSTTVVVTAIRGPLRAGAYRVRWVTAGSDGHPTSGDFAFEILAGAEGLGPAGESPGVGAVDTNAPRAPSMRDAPEDGGFDTSSPAYVALRWLLYLSIVLAVGAVAFRTVVIATLRRGSAVTPRWLAHATARAGGLGLGAAIALLVAASLRLWAQAAAIRGAGLALDADRLTTMVMTTSWGTGWMLQLAAAALLLLGFALARRSEAPAGWALAAVGALLVCITPGLSGHAAGAARPALTIAADALHVLGAGGWIGSLAVVMLAGVPAAFALQREERGDAVADLIGAFSPAALAFGALVALTGLAMAWIHLGEVNMLWASGYGRVLLVKLGVLALLGATAAYNLRRVKPRLGDTAGTRTLRPSAAAEVALAAVVLLVTAVLVATPIEPPMP
jgi:copper transport protein